MLPMKRRQIRLRLLLLVMALLAACFAWIGAVRSKLVAERSIERMNLEARLSSQERWRNTLREHLDNSPSPSVRRSVSWQLPRVEAEIAELKKQLDVE